MNVFQKIGAFFTDVVTFGEKLGVIFTQLQADSPELRTALTGLVSKLEAVGGDATLEIASDGSNLPEYFALANDSVAAVKYFRASVLPVIEQVYAQLKGDFAPAPAAPAAAAPAAAVAATAEPVAKIAAQP
jgi:hypothetical protein